MKKSIRATLTKLTKVVKDLVSSTLTQIRSIILTKIIRSIVVARQIDPLLFFLINSRITMKIVSNMYARTVKEVEANNGNLVTFEFG